MDPCESLNYFIGALLAINIWLLVIILLLLISVRLRQKKDLLIISGGFLRILNVLNDDPIRNEEPNPLPIVQIPHPRCNLPQINSPRPPPYVLFSPETLANALEQVR